MNYQVSDNKKAYQYILLFYCQLILKRIEAVMFRLPTSCLYQRITQDDVQYAEWDSFQSDADLKDKTSFLYVDCTLWLFSAASYQLTKSSVSFKNHDFLTHLKIFGILHSHFIYW